MKHIVRYILLTAIYTCLVSTILLFADEFYVKRTQVFFLNDKSSEPFSVNLGYNDGLAFVFKNTPLFLEGLEIEIKQSQDHLTFPDAFAYNIFTNVAPSPKATIVNYSGDMNIQGLLPNHSSHIIKIPIKANSSQEKDIQSSYLQTLPQSIFFRFYPAIKNLPNKFEYITFKVIIRPVLANRGGLKLNFQFPEKEPKPIKVQINKENFVNISDIQLMKPGNYLINITSDNYRSEVRSCVIEKGKITELDIILQSLISQLYIKAIKGASVFLDGEKVNNINKPLIVSPEVHSITFKIGNYELVRQINIKEGKKYYVTMTFDVILEEAE